METEFKFKMQKCIQRYDLPFKIALDLNNQYHYWPMEVCVGWSNANQALINLNTWLIERGCTVGENVIIL